MLFGVGTLHPKASLLAEMGDLPVRWRTKLRCMLFWVRVLSSGAYDGRLIRRVATEAAKFGRGSWLRKISMCCNYIPCIVSMTRLATITRFSMLETVAN